MALLNIGNILPNDIRVVIYINYYSCSTEFHVQQITFTSTDLSGNFFFNHQEKASDKRDTNEKNIDQSHVPSVLKFIYKICGHNNKNKRYIGYYGDLNVMKFFFAAKLHNVTLNIQKYMQ